MIPALLLKVSPAFNVFRYTTFRTACAMVTALIFCYLLYPPLIAWLRHRKMEQAIRRDGPEAHLDKIGTPTMGGVVMLAGITLTTALWARFDTWVPWAVIAVTLGYGLIGLYDDWKKVNERKADGLAGRWKLFWQTAVVGAVLGIAYATGLMDAKLHVPFYKHPVIDFAELWVGAPDVLGWLYVLFGVFVCVGASNAVNLTDGLDGLAIGSTITSACTFAVLGYVAGHAEHAQYLLIPYVPGAGELAVVCLAIVGAGLGFLWYNCYPAQIFMGDTGSLALGGALGTMAVLTKHEILLALVGGIFVMEALSVMIQVFWYKRTKKRVFKMAPIHHHFEKDGWSEPKIIVRFWIISGLLALVALSTLKLR